MANDEKVELALGNLLAIIFGDAGEKAASFPSPRDASEAAIQIFVDYKVQVEDPDILLYLQSRAEYWRTKSTEKVATIAERDATIEMLRTAIHHTQEYIGPGLLPALPGWSWYDALMNTGGIEK